ncbi:hypothetical protein [Roseovarius sp. MMSF_3305]|uniref:hypothetical protein n=1 Tax=Roseovarius sp. MMSF_3305 TaxID=3046697 RepID=UPI00273FE1AA|nr:hypothetical protein [Roseovarius sp. MMSF_3305]
MKIKKLIAVACVFFTPSAVLSQGLVPTLDREYEFCQERPPEPDWMQNLEARESHKRLLIQAIYRLEGYERVAEAGNCGCDTLYPSWDHAVQRFNDNYLHLEQFDLMQTRREFQNQGNAVRRSVRALCEAEGNW